MKRKTIITALLLCVTLFVPLSLFSQDLRTDFTGEGGEELVTRGDYVLRGTVLVQYQGTAEHVTIPVNLGITEIADHMFQHSAIVSITVPEGVQKIGSSFNECYSLTTVRLPESLRVIGKYAFDASNKLANVNIPAGVTTIEDCAFWECRSLTSITIPSSVTAIGSYAFYSCTDLASITIPSSVTSIGSYAFNGTAWFNDQPDGLVYAGKVLYTYKGTMPANTVINNMRADTIAIADGAFYGRNGLTGITIPSSVTIIGDRVFSYCRGLTGISVDTQNRAYSSVDGVLFNKNRTVIIAYPIAKQDRNYTIPSGVASVEDYAFSGCGSLTGVTIPSSVTSIGDGAFYECTGLTGVTVPSSVTSIGSLAFYNCRNLASITIPSSVTSIGSYAFNNTAWLNSQPDGLVYAGKVLYTYKGTMPANTVLNNIRADTIAIAERAFNYRTGLTDITIPSSVTAIGEGAFSGCNNLKTVTLSRRTTIGSNAFPSNVQITYSN